MDRAESTDIAMSMEAVCFMGPGDVRLVRLPVPVPGAGQVLVRVRAAGICQTDAHILAGHFPVAPPRVLGHEIAGEVAQLGTGVQGWSLGERVGVYPATFCGNCFACSHGRFRACSHFEGLGNTRDGGWAEYLCAEETQLVRLQHISALDAVWLEPISCILRALQGVEWQTVETALVMGAGPLGLLALILLHRQGVNAVLMADPNKTRLDNALRLGAAGVVEVPRTGDALSAGQRMRVLAPQGPDLIFDTTGKCAAVKRAVSWASHGALIVLFGVPAPQSRLGASMEAIFHRELTLRGSAGNGPAAYRAAAHLMEEVPLPLGELVGRRIARAEIPAVLADLTHSGHGGKVIVID